MAGAGPIVGYRAVNPNAEYIRAGFGAIANSARNTLQLPGINNWISPSLKTSALGETTSFNFARTSSTYLTTHSTFRVRQTTYSPWALLAWAGQHREPANLGIGRSACSQATREQFNWRHDLTSNNRFSFRACHEASQRWRIHSATFFFSLADFGSVVCPPWEAGWFVRFDSGSWTNFSTNEKLQTMYLTVNLFGIHGAKAAIPSLS